MRARLLEVQPVLVTWNQIFRAVRCLLPSPSPPPLQQADACSTLAALGSGLQLAAAALAWPAGTAGLEGSSCEERPAELGQELCQHVPVTLSGTQAPLSF